MAEYPYLQPSPGTREICTEFSGLNRCGDGLPGQLWDCENLSSRHYPRLSVRKLRGLMRRMKQPGGLLGREQLYSVEEGRLLRDGEPTGLEGISPGEKQLVSMGAYVCVFPDKLYYNSADPADFGSMEAHYSSSGTVEYSLCMLDGSLYAEPLRADSPPAQPAPAALWLDSSGERDVLRQWSEATEQWVELTAVYTKLSFISSGEIPALFSQLDGVELSGCAQAQFNGNHVIYALGGGGGQQDFIVLQGLLPQAFTQSEGSVSIRRTVPEMDYVCQSGNRLWGCRFGGGVNELYCCVLGDFKNWQRYLGLSTDSWRASVGSAGQWTGALSYMDSPCFFKEDGIHRISVSPQGAHRVSSMACPGIQSGSAASALVSEGAVYYKGREGVYVWQGGIPRLISRELGGELFSNAAAGALGDYYYIAMDDSSGQRSLYVFDKLRQLWLREDSLAARQFAAVGDELYCMAGDCLWALLGSRGEKEPFVRWRADSCLIGCREPNRKYVSRFKLRLWMEEGAQLQLYLRYDSQGDWLYRGEIKQRGRGSFQLPLIPGRCDHMQLRLCGKGDIRLLGMSRVVERGGDW